VEDLRIVPFDNAFASDFARLNYQWINEYFTVEDNDRKFLDDPVKNIIEPGGEIFFAVADATVVGTAALISDSGSRFELAKMAVDPACRGRGIGDALIEACIAHGLSTGKSSLFLLSNTKLEPALRLYKKHGFVEIFPDDAAGYQRVNIVMELALRDENR
jgi:putative acetyltransferase